MGEFSKFMYNQCNYITMAKKDNNIENGQWIDHARSGRYSGPWREYQDKRSRIKTTGR